MIASNNIGLSDFCGGVIQGVGISTVIALAIIWVPIITKLRRKVNKLIDEIGVNL